MNKRALVAAIAATGIGIIAARQVADLPRGYRNNNPGNIRENGQADDQWKGEALVDWDPEFEEFADPASGYRALAVVLRNYQRRHGLKTVRQVITRWAPPSENNTESYVRSVELFTGYPADEPLNLARPDVLLPLVKAIAKHENGFLLHGDDVITAKWEFA